MKIRIDVNKGETKNVCTESIFIGADLSINVPDNSDDATVSNLIEFIVASIER